ncbi:hypothetical protein IU440_28735 [Nocardia cyriacigeorgica]|uniref:hypothetical protein n=1 Tax=Nocardia cyriacigeorgica TaxID=135487 RepID=UPI0018933B4F|nr:hypothetical protein [Nocardia cyriacigeorgica]MBF6428666.1 hypothetical protein [Nocardia cyriacigeorgica]
MSDDFKDMGDILNQWMNDGPKEVQSPSSLKHIDVMVYLTNGTIQGFSDAEIMDIGGRVIVMEEAGTTIFNDRNVMFYEITPMETDEDG